MRNTWMFIMLFSVIFYSLSYAQTDQQELARPGPEHDMLKAYSGEWDVNILFGMGGSQLEYNGKASNRMVAGNRFLICDISAESSMGALQGMFTIGFDRRHSEYTIQAIDTWGTYFVSAKGVKDEESGLIKLYGTDDDPHMKSLGLAKEFAYALNFGDADKFNIEVFMIDNRTDNRMEMKMLEYRFVRSGE